jgi:hypothetical protein
MGIASFQTEKAGHTEGASMLGYVTRTFHVLAIIQLQIDSLSIVILCFV